MHASLKYCHNDRHGAQQQELKSGKEDEGKLFPAAEQRVERLSELGALLNLRSREDDAHNTEHHDH